MIEWNEGAATLVVPEAGAGYLSAIAVIATLCGPMLRGLVGRAGGFVGKERADGGQSGQQRVMGVGGEP